MSIIQVPSVSLPQRGGKEYLADFNRRMATSDENWKPWPEAQESKTKAFLKVVGRRSPAIQFDEASELLASYNLDAGSEPQVCVIENISSEYIQALGSAWNIDIEFFVEHATNPKKDHLWQLVSTMSWDLPISAGYETSIQPVPTYWHLDGIYEYNKYTNIRWSDGKLDSFPNNVPRHCFSDAESGVQSNTRISYYRVSSSLYLFLVDAPLSILNDYTNIPLSRHPTLRFLYASNSGGVELPQLLSHDKHSIFESLKSFFYHGWYEDLLYQRPSGVLPPHVLLYLLSSSVSQSNLRYLKREIERISFDEIRNPRLNTNNTLHDRREDLARLKSLLVETNTWVFPEVKEYFKKHPFFVTHLSTWKASPLEELKESLSQAIKLEAFLMETFQLLMSSISVQDSQISIEQARRTTTLTVLAFIYIPLSLVTGIFGMNIREINGSPLSVWVCFVTIVIVVALSAIALLVLIRREKRKKKHSMGKDLTA